MEFVEQKVVNGCRAGKITMKNDIKKHFDTPACILYTRGGSAPHLTTDLVENYVDEFAGIHITLPTTFQHPGPDVLKEYGGSMSTFLGIKKDHFIYCSVHDPSQETQCSYNEKKTISVWNSSGRKKIDVNLFLEILKSFLPDMVQCLCDTVPAGQSAKRNRKSVDRTLKFLDEVLEHQKKHEALKSVRILGSVEGGDSEVERVRSAVETSKRAVSGFVVEGFVPSVKNWASLLKTCINHLPGNKPRFFTGSVTPDEIFCALECGVDVFDSSFAYEATQRGCAINLQPKNKRIRPEMNHTIESKENCATLRQDSPTRDQKAEESETTKSCFEIYLENTRYKEDFSPLVVGCSCYSCTNHTRAYVYHLLQTKEMLAQVLLMIHNFHQYFRFFKKLREAINDDEYTAFKSNFLGT